MRCHSNIYKYCKTMYIKSGTSRGKKDVGKAKEYYFKMSKREKQIVFLDHLSGFTLPFSVSELFYNTVSCRKLIIMQSILVYRNADYSCLAGMQLITALFIDQFLHLFVSSLQHSFITHKHVAL